MTCKEYPATERQLSEWEYAQNHVNYSGNLLHIATLEHCSFMAVENAFASLISRHESLRTTFSWSLGELIQLVHPPEAMNFKVEFLDLCRDGDINNALSLKYAELINTRLDRVQGPLIRSMLIQVGTSECILVFVINHLISDLASIEILKKDFSVYYNSFMTGGAIDLEPLYFQMKDYAIWEKQYNTSDAGFRNLMYWKKILMHDLEEFCLALENGKVQQANEKIGEMPGGVFEYFIENSVLNKSISHYRSKSLFLIACLFLWLFSISQQKKIILAIPFSSRDNGELEKVVGYLMAGMYLRIDFHQVTTFGELFSEVVKKYSAALTHRHYSRRSLGIDIDKFCSAFFNNVTLIKNELDFDVSTLRDDHVQDVPYYRMAFEIHHFRNGWHISCKYHRSLFGNTNVIDLLKQFEVLTNKVANDPGIKIVECVATIHVRE